MQNGIYHVRFSSPQGSAGEGLVVIKDGSVNGGDTGYLYFGQLVADGANVSGQLEIKRWNTTIPSIFGPLNQFTLALAGTTTGDAFTVGGGMQNQPNLKISITGKKLSDAA